MVSCTADVWEAVPPSPCSPVLLFIVQLMSMGGGTPSPLLPYSIFSCTADVWEVVLPPPLLPYSIVSCTADV